VDEIISGRDKGFINCPTDVATEYNDGTMYAENPDGSSTTEYPDGTTNHWEPDGTTHVNHPDGTFEINYPDGTRAGLTKKPRRQHGREVAGRLEPPYAQGRPAGGFMTGWDGTKYTFTRRLGQHHLTLRRHHEYGQRRQHVRHVYRREGHQSDHQPDGTIEAVTPEGDEVTIDAKRPEGEIQDVLS